MSLLGELTYALIAPSQRAIATLVPDVIVEEIHRDGLIITQHPVEKGAAITDHAFKRCAEVEIRCGFSNSTAGSEGYAREVYQSFLALQASRRPFSVYTGKRAYRDMLIADLGVTTDVHSENILAVSVRLQQIIIVSTQTTGTGTGTAAAGSSSDGTGSAATDDIANRGEQSGIGTDNQSFAGSFNPGNFNTDGGALGNGSFGGLGTPDGISSPTDVTLPEQSVTGDAPRPEGVIADPYNVFGS